MKKESSGILNWMLEGYIRYKKAGKLHTSKSVNSATNSYKSDENSIERFTSECLIADIEALTKARTMYNTYKYWAEREGDEIMNNREFKAQMHNNGFESIRLSGGNFWRGVDISMVLDSPKTSVYNSPKTSVYN